MIFISLILVRKLIKFSEKKLELNKKANQNWLAFSRTNKLR